MTYIFDYGHISIIETLYIPQKYTFNLTLH